MSLWTKGLQSYYAKSIKRLTFSIFLCGCKLSGTLRSANLSTMSAAKVGIICNSTKKLSFNFLFPAGTLLPAGLLADLLFLLSNLLLGLDGTLGLDLNHPVCTLHSVN